MSHLKDGILNSENKLQEFVCDRLNNHNDSYSPNLGKQKIRTNATIIWYLVILLASKIKKVWRTLLDIYTLSLSAFPLICGVNFFFFYVCGRFSTLSFLIIFGVGLPAYLSNHNPFSREHILVGSNEFPSLMYWCTVIHHHRPQGPTLFRTVRWDFTCVQCYVCTYTGPPVLSPIRED